jgi:hypothetical protein
MSGNTPARSQNANEIGHHEAMTIRTMHIFRTVKTANSGPKYRDKMGDCASILC